MIDNSQNLKVKTTLKNYPNLSNFYYEKMYKGKAVLFNLRKIFSVKMKKELLNFIFR